MSDTAGKALPIDKPEADFPRTFYYANAIELFERLAHYGLYIGLSLYLTNIVHMGDKEVGSTLGNWRLVASLAPIPCGAIADRIDEGDLADEHRMSRPHRVLFRRLADVPKVFEIPGTPPVGRVLCERDPLAHFVFTPG